MRSFLRGCFFVMSNTSLYQFSGFSAGKKLEWQRWYFVGVLCVLLVVNCGDVVVIWLVKDGQETVSFFCFEALRRGYF